MSFRTHRSGAGLTLAEVAREFGISVDVAPDWEEGKAQPPAHVIRSLDLIGSFTRPAQPPAPAPRPIPLPLPAPRQQAATSLIKSKKRVADHGEVFTPPWLVEKMLDLAKGETERINSRFLEPACGSGNLNHD